MDNRTRLAFFCSLAALLLAAGLVSCERGDRPEKELEAVEQVAVDFSLSVGNSLSGTKADVGVLTELGETPVFRGMNGLVVVPFSNTAPIPDNSAALAQAWGLPSILGSKTDAAYSAEDKSYFPGIVNGNYAHLYGSQDVSLPVRTSSLLIYGWAQTENSTKPGATVVDNKHLNGSLIPRGFDAEAPTAESFSFEPEAILDARLDQNNNPLPPVEAEEIVAALNAVIMGEPFTMDAYYAPNPADPAQLEEVEAFMPWNGDIGDPQLKACYLEMISDGILMSGSGSSVEELLTSLYQRLDSYEIIRGSSYPYEQVIGGQLYELKIKEGEGYATLLQADMYDGVRRMVLERIEHCDLLTVSSGDHPKVTFRNASVSVYPESKGLPSGAAAVRWTSTGYVVPLEDGLDGIAPISHYCYPPALFYYSQSNIKTSDDETVRSAYNKDNDWLSILNQYSGNTITRRTRSVAVKDAMQYAVGTLRMRVKAKKAQLLDSSGIKLIDVTGDAFPVKGIIFGGQYIQNYDFTPAAGSSQYYLYDNLVSGIKLGTEFSPVFTSLSLQTPDGADVYFTLELENRCGEDIYGAEGRIPDGHRFYLVGKLEVPPADDPVKNPSGLKSVIVKDRYTVVDCIIPSFKQAHNSIPDLGIPQLALGIEAQVNWTLSTPSTLIL